MVVSTIMNSFFTIIKQRTTFWPVIIPLLSDLSSNLTDKFPPSQVVSLKFTLRQILMFLLKMTQTYDYRKPIIDALQKLDIKGEIIEQTVKLVDVSYRTKQIVNLILFLESITKEKKFRRINKTCKKNKNRNTSRLFSNTIW